MKANELMIGDWVSHFDEGKNCMVTELRGRKVAVSYTDDNGNTKYSVLLPEMAFEPIPLTAQILEKNGFKNLSLNDPELINYVFKASFVHKSPLPNVEVLRVNYYDGVEWDFYALLGERESSDCGEQYEYIIIVKYVHELQRALRLCHINKEIEL